MPGLRYWDGTAWQPIAPSPAVTNLDPWHLVGAAGEPAFQTGWQNYAGDNPVGFRKDPQGRVLIKGLAQMLAGAAVTIVILPAGHRPAKTTRFTVASSKGPLFVQIDLNGYVAWQGLGSYATLAANDWADLSGIEFDTESVTSYPIGPVGPPGPTPAAVTLDTWHTVGAAGEPAFASGVGVNGVEQRLQFRKAPDGKVLLRGSATCPNVTAQLFTLPAGYRPPASYVRFACTDASAGIFVDVYIDVNGIVSKVGTPTTVDVAAVEFDTDTVSLLPQGPAGPMGPPGPAGAAPVATLDPWHNVGAAGEPAFQSSWTNFGAPYASLAFRKDPTGKVLLRGTIKGGAPSTVPFTLPPGYRPPASVIQTCWCSPITGSYVQIDSTGVITAAGPAGITTSFDVSSVEFDTDTVTQITAVAANVQMDTWHTVGAAGEPAFQNSWVNYGGGFMALAFRKDPTGKVQIRGSIKSGTLNTVVFTLPAGYRPVAGAHRTSGTGAGAAASAFCLSNISTNGDVAVYPDSNGLVSLDGIEFDTDSVTQVAAGAASQPIEPVHIVGNPGEPAFQNSWVNYAGYGGARFRRYPDGRVRLSGAITGGTAGTAAFTLPAGYRPTAAQAYNQWSGGTASAVSLTTSGAVIPSLGGANYVFLDGIEFDTETVGNYTVGSINGTGLWLPQDEGVDLAGRAKVNFVGSGVSVADDSPNNRANVSILGGAGLRTVTIGPITGNGGVLVGSPGAIPGMGLPVVCTVPMHCVVWYQARFENSAATWLWTYSSLSCSGAQFQLKSGANLASDLKTYYGSVNWNQNQGWDYFRLPVGSFTVNLNAWQSGSTVYWLASAENYMTALMWPQ